MRPRSTSRSAGRSSISAATGNMLAAILERYSGPRGILYDLPHVVATAPKLLAAAGVGDRVSIQTGTFFAGAPAGGRLCPLAHPARQASRTVPGHVREAIDPGGRLIIVEFVIPVGDAPHPSKMFNMPMLAILGGMERTEAEYARLLAKAGFERP